MKKSLLSGLAVAVGLLAATTANAQIHWESDATSVNSKSSGTFHVTLAEEGLTNVFDVTVKGNVDGKPPGSPPKSPIQDVVLTFFDVSNNSLTTDPGSSSGHTTAGGTFVASTWTPQPAVGEIDFKAPTPTPTDLTHWLGPKGENMFIGKAVISAGAQFDIADITVSLNDHGQQYFLDCPGGITPEASSLLLLAPGLLPLGVVLRRRRTVRT
jgi:hypothetical protein